MFTRTTHTTVTFARPFTLAGMTGEQPPGTYQVETDEELIDGLSFTAFRRTATWIVLPQGRAAAVREVVVVDPAELDAALDRDRLA